MALTEIDAHDLEVGQIIPLFAERYVITQIVYYPDDKVLRVFAQENLPENSEYFKRRIMLEVDPLTKAHIWSL